MEKNIIQFVSPIDGDMLHTKDGVLANGSLQTKVTVSAPPDSLIKINGIPATGKDGLFTATLSLPAYRNLITAVDALTGEAASVIVYRLTHFAGHYRLSIDDNIWFLRDIHRNTDKYQSLFDNAYLGFLKSVHDTYGTKVHLNLFYETDGFNLSQLSDKFKPEWKANADWLRLSFHALGEFPDMPYKDAGYDQVKKDCDLVKGEIKRFAGEELMGPFTTLHWGTANIEGSRALRDAGYKGLLGYFNIGEGELPIGYYVEPEERKHIHKRFIWKDNKEDIIFVRTSIVIDKTDLGKIDAHLDNHEKTIGKPPYLDLLVHEQYFYPFYEAYEPDYRDRILACVKWAGRNGYTPAFLSDCIFE